MSKWKDLIAQNAVDEKPKEEPKKKVREAPIDDDTSYPSLEELESDLEQSLDNIDLEFRERAHQEKQRFAESCDSIYYFTVYFSNRQQLIEFCERFDMDYTQFYFDGRDLARKFRMTLKANDFLPRRTNGVSQDYLDRVREVNS